MSFDPHSLKRLRELGRQLPKELPKPKVPTKNQGIYEATSRLHNIETEKDPKILFQELIKASPDGRVPSHLIARLKDLETHQIKNNDEKDSPKQINTSNMEHSPKDFETENLYASFKMLLLENEDDI